MNFVRFKDSTAIDDSLKYDDDKGVEERYKVEPHIKVPDIQAVSSKIMDEFRDKLADRMWLDYKAYLRRHNMEVPA